MAIYQERIVVLTDATSSFGAGDVFSGITGREDGAAIYVNGGGKLIVDGAAVFRDNFVSSASGRGGAIYNNDTTTLRNVTFITNSAGRDGGAIVNNGILHIDGGAFSGNAVQYSGGAIRNLILRSAVISGTVFASNSALFGGGAIYNQGSATIVNVTFSGNSANVGGAIYNARAGAMIVSGAIFATAADTVFNSGSMVFAAGTNVFNAPFTNVGSGMITISGSAVLTTGVVQDLTTAYRISVQDVPVGEYFLVGDWGLTGTTSVTVTMDGESGTITATEPLTLNGETYRLVINAEGTRLQINIPVIDETGATAGSFPSFNALAQNMPTYTGAVEVVSATVTESLSPQYSKVEVTGHLAVLSQYTVNSEFRVAESGTLLVSGGRLDVHASAELRNATFLSNTPHEDLECAMINDGAVTASNVIFSGNIAEDGAAIYNYGSMVMVGADFVGNSAYSHGGAINNQHYGSGVALTSANFSGNSAAVGGAIYQGADTAIEMQSVTFRNNSAVSGGAFYNYGGAAVFTGVAFSSNRASYGGAIYRESGSLELVEVTFRHNSANSGGAIYNTMSGAVFDGSASFESNRASYGGAIYNAGSASFTGAALSANRAVNGGAIYNAGSANITAMDFSANSANSGGGVYVEGEAVVSSANFSGNSAHVGGAICNRSSAILSAVGNTFSGNSAIQGGAIYNGGSAFLRDVTFSGNFANYGGAVFNASRGELWLSSTTFVGDGIYNNGGTVHFGSGDNLFVNATFRNGGNGVVSGAGAGNTTIVLSGAACLINNNGSQEVNITSQATIRLQDISTVSAFMIGSNWGLVKDVTTFEVITAGGAVTATLGSSYTDADAKFWIGSNNGRTGVVDRLLINQNAAEDYRTFNAVGDYDDVYTDYSGDVEIQSATLVENTFMGKAKAVVTGKLDGDFYLQGGKLNSVDDNASNTIEVADTATVDVKGIFAAGRAMSIADETHSASGTLSIASGAAVHAKVLLGGGFYYGLGTQTFNGNNTITIASDNVTCDSYLTGGSSITGATNYVFNGNNTLNVSGGTYRYHAAGAGFLQSPTGTYTHNGDVNLTISGGTFESYIFGGCTANKSAYGVNTEVTGNINVTVDTGENDVNLTYLFGGSNGAGVINNTLVTFKGDGNKLHFATKSTVCGTSFSSKAVVNGASVLKFDNFQGEFTVRNIIRFNEVYLTGGSQVDQTSATTTVQLAGVSTWKFDADTSLKTATSQAGNMSGDTLIIGESGGQLVNIGDQWTVIEAANANFFTGIEDAAGVTLFGEAASYANSVWATADYELSVNDKKLIVTKIA